MFPQRWRFRRVRSRMTSKRPLSRGFVSLLLLGSLAAGPGYAKDDSAEVEQLKRALAAELSGVQDTQHPMRYRLCKSSPRYATTKDIFETKDGAVARLVAINNQPLSPEDAQKEQDRLTALLNDPGKQRHRKQAEEDDTNRVVKVIRALPDAFLFESMGAGEGPHGKVEKFSFTPNPNFDPQDLETTCADGVDRGDLGRSCTDARRSPGRTSAAGRRLRLGHFGSPQQRRLDRDRGVRSRKPSVAHRPLPDGDERPRSVQDEVVRHPGG